MNPTTYEQTRVDRLVRGLATVGLLSLAAALVAVGVYLYG